MTPHRLRALVAALLVFLLAPAMAHAYSNGQLPRSALSPVATGVHCDAPRGQLANRAAAGYNTMALAAGHQLPDNGCGSAYRPIGHPGDGCAADTQWGMWDCYGAGQAAYPGTSNHGLGVAIDVRPTVRSFIDSTAGAYGFWKPCSDAEWESWHVKFCRPFTRPNPGTHLRSPRLVRGSGGPGQAAWVRKAQKLLRRHGASHITPDGILGPHTCFALKRFKKAEHLTPKCSVTLATWKELRKPVVKPHPGPKPPTPHPHHHHRGPVSGVDVSEHQGSVNWQKVRRDHKRFAIVKATEGQDYRDHAFSRARLDAIKKAGLVPGVYHFLRPRSDRPGSREATWFIQNITAAGYGEGFLPPVMDLETTELSASGTCRYAHQFYARVKRSLHLHAIIYTYPGFAASYLSGCDWMAHKRLWIAHYGVQKPTVPSPWSRYLMWQFTASGHVDGINGSVDVDKLPGGIRALRKLQVDPAKQVVRKPKVKVPATASASLPTNPAVRLPARVGGE